VRLVLLALASVALIFTAVASAFVEARGTAAEARSYVYDSFAPAISGERFAFPVASRQVLRLRRSARTFTGAQDRAQIRAPARRAEKTLLRFRGRCHGTRISTINRLGANEICGAWIDAVSSTSTTKSPDWSVRPATDAGVRGERRRR